MKEEVAAQRVKALLRDNLYKREVLVKSGGNIAFDRLARYKTTKYIRKKALEKSGNQLNVEILLDNSGSMYPFGWRTKNIAIPAHDAAYRAIRTLKSVANINLTLFNYLEVRVPIDEFTPTSHLYRCEGVGTIDIETHRYYEYENDGVTHIESVKPGDERDFDEDAAAGGNYEIASILNAAERLKSLDGDKMIMVFSDGRPNLDDHDPSDPIVLAGRRIDKYPKSEYADAISGIARAGGIHILSFGIETSDPEKYYPIFRKIDDVEMDMYPALIDTIKEAIKN